MSIFISCNNNTKERKMESGKAFFEYFKYSGNDSFYNNNSIKEGQFYNPILPGYYPDPSICKKGDDYYLVNSTFAYFPGVPIFHSKDLVNWKQIGHVLDRPSQLDITELGTSRGIFAPAISYNPHNNTFYMITTCVDCGGNFIVTAKDPAGQWSDPIWLPEVGGIDPSLFFDDDGKAYIVNNDGPEGEPLYEGHRAIWFQEFNVDSNKIVGKKKVVVNGGHDLSEKPIWIEGPHIYKINDYYYIMAAEGGTGINHSEVIFRSKNVTGPYKTYQNNPILTQRNLSADRPNPVTNTGHADLIQFNDSSWYAVFLACRPYNDKNYFNIGRETFLLPVKWENDWPVILQKDSLVSLISEMPLKTEVKNDAANMKQGNFTYVDNFGEDKLALDWIFLRTPKEKWYEVEKSGGVSINLRDVNLRELKNPSAIFRRQQHHELEVETALNFQPNDSSDLAGLTFYQNKDYHFVLGIAIRNGKKSVVLQKAVKQENGSNKEIIAEKVLDGSFDGRIELKVRCEKNQFSFFYKTEDNWVLLEAKVDAGYLSTEVAQGFVGTTIGLYASSNE